jgi:hypothetical protein
MVADFNALLFGSAASSIGNTPFGKLIVKRTCEDTANNKIKNYESIL